jgi:REP element-mobilizing transposase RayT
MNAEPLGLFITWTVYGTYLPGDSRGWTHRDAGHQLGRPQLEKWQRLRLRHPPMTLTQSMRCVTDQAIREICRVRNWSLWAVMSRSNHAHVVLTAASHRPHLVREQLKAKSTRDLRNRFVALRNRPVWSSKGDIQFLDSDSDIERCVEYVVIAQDRKARDQMQ